MSGQLIHLVGERVCKENKKSTVVVNPSYSDQFEITKKADCHELWRDLYQCTQIPYLHGLKYY